MSTPTPPRLQPIVKTYRYLRLAMVLLVVMLGVSVALEWWATGRRCFQDSISAYYFTPVQAVFVGTLTAIGVCMVVIKGNTEWEDILLNLGGMLLPVVALVPEPEEGQCRSVPQLLQDVPAKVANNVGALLVTGVLALAVVVTIVLRSSSAAERSRAHLTGTAVAAATLLAGIVWFTLDRPSFIEGAHYVAAVGMFACIVVVVVLNARGFRLAHHEAARPTRRQFVNRYAVIAVLMVVSAAGMGLYAVLFGWEHWLLWVEGTLITLFAAFWLSQTEELWHQGLRNR
jgi:FtsH-binding integral membrane protein